MRRVGHLDGEMIFAGRAAEPHERLRHAVFVGQDFRREDFRFGFAAGRGFDAEVDGGAFHGFAVSVHDLHGQRIAHDGAGRALPFVVLDLRADDHADEHEFLGGVQGDDLHIIVADLVPGADGRADHADHVGRLGQRGDLKVGSVGGFEPDGFVGQEGQFARRCGVVAGEAADFHAEVAFELLSGDGALVGAVNHIQATDFVRMLRRTVAGGESRDQEARQQKRGEV